jgi:DNA-binding XRE family transcriptional regulator
MSAADHAAKATINLNAMPDSDATDERSSPTVPYEEVKARLLADPNVLAAYDALEPAYQIARLRIAAGLTQAQLAELVGTKQPSIARLERGQTQPTIPFLRKLAEALGARLEVNFVPLDER